MNSTTRKRVRRAALSELREGELEFLFLAPEQLRRRKIREQLKAAAAGFGRQRRLHEQALLRIERMRGYAELRDCRRVYLLNYFGEDAPPCGHCDNCRRGLPQAQNGAQLFPLKTRVMHRRFGRGLVRAYDGAEITVLFDDLGEKRLDLHTVLARNLLAPA